MKKVLAIVIAVMLVAAFSVPVMADVTTTVDVVDPAGDQPLVKCKWETPDDGDLYYPSYLDESNNEAYEQGTQVMPNEGTISASGEPTIGEKEVFFWAVVEKNVYDVSRVWANVYHPQLLKQVNLSEEIDPSGEWCGSLKYEVVLDPYNPSNNDKQWDAFMDAYEAHLVKFNETWLATFNNEAEAIDDIHEEIYNGVGQVYRAKKTLQNHQPAGDYLVEVKAVSTGTPSVPVINTMTFVAMDSLLVDFATVDYGEAGVYTWTMAPGDPNLGTPLMPTVWNNGNTYINVTVEQDDAEFGFRNEGPDDVWNVRWRARLGSEDEGTVMEYDPYEKVTLPELLVMCTPTKIDFWIYPDKADELGGHTGTMTLGCEHVPFTPCCE